MNNKNFELINKAKQDIKGIENSLKSFENADYQISLIEIDILKDKLKNLYLNIDKMEISDTLIDVDENKKSEILNLQEENDIKTHQKEAIIDNNDAELSKNNDFDFDDTIIFEKKEEIIVEEKEEIDTSTPSDAYENFFGNEENNIDEQIEDIINEEEVIREEVIEEEIIVDEPIVDEPIVDEPIVDKKEEVVEEDIIEEKEVVSEEKTEKKNILADKFTQKSHSLIDEIQNNNNSIGDKMRDKPISDINSSISMNDRFWLQKELFNGKQEDLFIAINKLNSCNDLDEALNIFNKIAKKNKWEEENRAVSKLKKLVERRYL